LIKDGDLLTVDLGKGRCDLVISHADLARWVIDAKGAVAPPNTPWKKLFQENATQLSEGMVLQGAPEMRNTSPSNHHDTITEARGGAEFVGLAHAKDLGLWCSDPTIDWPVGLAATQCATRLP